MTAVPAGTGAPSRSTEPARTAGRATSAGLAGTMVPMLQALSWGRKSPLFPSGEVDIEALARGLARSDHPGARPRQPYTRAQHALVVSEAVGSLAGLRLPERRVLAMHAWLAEVRNAELRDKKHKHEGGARQRLALRTMDLEPLADVLARTTRWDGGRGRGDGVSNIAAAFDASLQTLGGLNAENRNRLSLYGLLVETVLAGLGMATAEAALEAAGLPREAPAPWVDILRFVRRMAEAAVHRDLQGAAYGDRPAFPAIEKRIEPLDPGEAAKRWLARYRALTGTTKEGRT